MADDLIQGGATIVPPPSVPAHDVQATARYAGHEWDDIHGYEASMHLAGDQAGYSPREIDDHLGWPDPQPFHTRTAGQWSGRLAEEPTLADVLKPDATTPPDFGGADMRVDYAQALIDGHVHGADDFAQHYMGGLAGQTGSPDDGSVAPETQARAIAVGQEIARTLPSADLFTDMAIGLTHSADLPVTPETIANTRANLITAWASSGDQVQTIFDAAQQNPELRDKLTQPVSAPSRGIGDVLTHIFDTTKEGFAQGFEGSIATKTTAQWGAFWKGFDEKFGSPDTPLGALNHLVGIAAVGGLGYADAALRLPMATIFGLAGTARGILDEAGIKDDLLDQTMRELVLPGLAEMGGRGGPARADVSFRVVDPLKPPAEAVQTLSGERAFTPQISISSKMVPGEPPIIRFRKDAAAIEATLPTPEEGTTRLWRGNRPGEIGTATVFTNDMPGIALPFREPYGGDISYVDVPTADLVKYENFERGPAEYLLPSELAAEAKGVNVKPNLEELSKGYDAATALWGKLTEMHTGINLPNAWRGLQQLWRGPEGMIEAAAKAADKDYQQAVIRRYRGMADHEIAAHFNTLEEFRSAINEHMPDFARWVRMGPMKPEGAVPVIMDLYNFMEGRSVGATLHPDSPLAQVADALRVVHESVRKQIEEYAPDMGSFIDDYVRHLWTNPLEAQRAFGAGRQGSGASLNKRTIPTISEGLDRGLMPKILDPIENTLHYTAGMLRFIAARKILEENRDAGYVKYSTSGAPEPGWVQLKGAASVLPAGEGIQRAYAPPGAAEPYNNWIGRGIYDWSNPRYGTIYEKLQVASNAMTALKLAWSGYHAVNIVKETMIAQLANGIGEVSRGDLTAGLRDMGYGVTMLPGVVDYAAKGAAFQKKYLNLGNDDPIVKLLTEAGFNPLGRSQRYGGVTSPDVQMVANGASFMQMLRRRSLGWTLAEEGRRIGGSAEDGTSFRRVMMAPGRAAGFMIHQFERVLDAFNAPLFNVMIPKIKAGAASAEMETWLRRNPDATLEEQRGAARKISDSMDDRFGELNQDNLFWPRTLKQMLNLFTISVGWEYGTLRAYGGGAKDLLGADPTSTRARWLLAFPMIMAYTNAVYQYLHTGQLPQEAKDLVLPKTGGTFANRYGEVPERVLAPGYEKDALQTYKTIDNVPDFTHIPANAWDQAMNKLSPMWQFLRTGIRGQDPIGHNIAEEANPPLQNWGVPPGLANWVRYMGRELTPIAAENQMELRPGTHVNRLERWLGFRPAGAFFQNPEGAAVGLAAHERTLQRQERVRALREQQ